MTNSLDKAQAIHDFWASFDIPAYDENTVPTGEDAPEFPYITHSVATDSIGNVVQLSGSLWYRTPTWEEIDLKAEQIAKELGEYGHKVIKIDGGYVFLVKGTPFAQRMSDPSDDMVRRIYINVLAEFLTAY